MTEEKNRELLLELVGQSEQETLPPGYELKSKSIFTLGDLSYTVRVCFVDLTTVVSGGNFHLYSKSDTLIKYSEARFSPVSSEPTDYIQLATPSYYQNLNSEGDSELIGDDLESAYIERPDWFPNVPNVNIEVKLTRTLLSEFWMYCTSIDPYLSYERQEQMKRLSPQYDFMAKIDEPSKFAEQLGDDVGQQIELHHDFKFRPAGGWEGKDVLREAWNAISSMSGEQSLGGQGRNRADFLISVNHGPVIYLEEDEIEESKNNVPKGHGGDIIPFLKRKKYEEQQEYRFVIRVRYHSPNKDTFYLKVSDELRNLMAPIESI